VGGGGEIAGDEGSVADLGEWGVIAALKARMPAGALTSVGIGDDSAVISTPSGSVVAAVDLVIEGRHFRREWSSARDVGVKAAARSLADIAAMGAVNTALLIGLAAPGTLPARWATELAEGLAAEATRAGAGIVGGDTARADSITVSVTALGDLAGRRPVLRSGARPGDVIAVAGRLGHSAAGLAMLTSGLARGHASGSGSGLAPGVMSEPARGVGSAPARGVGSAPARGATSEPARGGGSEPAWEGMSEPARGVGSEPARRGGSEPERGVASELAPGLGSELAPGLASGLASGRAPGLTSVSGSGLEPGSGSGAAEADTVAALVAAHLRPAPPYEAGPEAARLGATAMIDVSDGLLADLGHVAAASGVRIDVNSAVLAPGPALCEAAARLPVPGESSKTPVASAPVASAPVASAAAAIALEWVLTGGEDHALVAAFPPGTVLPARWRVIGGVTAGAGVTVDGAPHEGPAGWQHFR
jgi:thiamine-monophosphate kinase